MKLKYKLLVLLVAAFVLGAVQGDSDKYFKMAKGIDIFGRVYKEINMNYVDQVDPEKFMLEGIKGMLGSLDPYTNFIDADKQQDIQLFTKGKYGGIGVTVGLKDGNIIVVDILEGYSAHRQGMRIGDIIKMVDSTSVSDKNYDDLSKYMKGDPGTSVALTVNRPGVNNPVKFNLVREEIIIKNLSYFGFWPANSNNAYLKLSGFTRSAGSEVKKAIIELRKEKPVNSIILDLRGNPGGLLDAAIDVTEKFIKKDQLVVSVKGRDSLKVDKYFSKEEPIAGDAKLVVLVDGGSASASEIVAGAIQDYDRGIVIGSRSFGKGLVQTIVPLSYNSSLKVTTGKYYTPSGRCIQKVDYSKDNKVFTKPLLSKSKKFVTTNKREVYSGGGILPDTVVSGRFESKQINALIAQGLFFRFATLCYNKNTNLKISQINNDELFGKFLDFVKEQKFDFISESEMMLSKLHNALEKDKYSETVKHKVDELDKLIDEVKNRELVKHKKEIVNQIKIEISSRLAGIKGRISESLKYDRQVDVAVDLLKSGKNYKEILAINE